MGGFSMGGMGGGGGSSYMPQAFASMGEGVNFLQGLHANDNASDALTARQNQANDFYTQQFGLTSADLDPYVTGGAAGWKELLGAYNLLGNGGDNSALFSKLESSPDYQFAMQQGMKGLDRSAASRGRLYSGAQIQGATKLSGGLATQNLNNYLNRLGQIAQTGLGAATTRGNFRAGYSSQYGEGLNNLGNIAASEYLGVNALHDRYHRGMEDIWGVGGGAGGSPGGSSGGAKDYSAGMNMGSSIKSRPSSWGG